MADGPEMTYVYLQSVEHSGSTLIACLVDAHPEVTGVGEFGTPFSPQGNCSCGAPVDRHPFRQGVIGMSKWFGKPVFGRIRARSLRFLGPGAGLLSLGSAPGACGGTCGTAICNAAD